jgi:hypothetical protein
VIQGGRVAAFVLVGAAIGVFLTLLTGGTHLFAAKTNPPSPSVTASVLPANAFLAAGGLLVGAPACQSGHPIVPLVNHSTTAIAFSAGSPDDASVIFADAANTTPSQTLFASVAPNTSDTLTLTTPTGSATHFTIVVTAQGGSVELPAKSC